MVSKGFFTRCREDKGSALVLTALSVVVLFGFFALSIDIGHVMQQQREIQSATDAAALAGVLFLTNRTATTQADAIARAQTVAQTNGVSLAETTAGGGAIEVGNWNTNTLTFTAGGSSVTWNAVRVPAKRSVPFVFGNIPGTSLGTSQKVTAVNSVAMLAGAGSAFGGGGVGMLPFGANTTQATNAFYKSYTVSQGQVGGSGNFGILDLGTDWHNAMVNGCECTYSVGQSVNTTTGKNGNCLECTGTGFQDRMDANPYAVMPIVESWPSGNSGDAKIVGFVGVKILDVSTGGGWTITLENVPLTIAGSGGGTTNAPYAMARVLVH